MRKNLIYIAFAFILCACQEKTISPVEIDGTVLEKHVAEISKDYYEGRRPFTTGEKRTVAYLEEQLKTLGLKPGNNGSYTQDVPLIEITGEPAPEMLVKTQGGEITLENGKDYVLHTEGNLADVRLEDSDLVFCGYGIVDEARGWDDYAGVDMTGKTAVVLVNDPGYGGEDSTFFKGDIMTYFGRWTYKYDEADKQGADGLLIIHETSSAGYPWYVVSSSWSGAQLGIKRNEGDADCKAKGWISLDKANQIFSKAGHSLPQMIRAARKKGFKPVPLNANVTATVNSKFKEDVSKNVLAYVEGAKRPDEFIVINAHWDHLGIAAPVAGDSIYNGAYDNATGTAAAMSIAEAFTKMPQPDRSVLFLLVTAEEQGLLGSAYYTENPTIPMDKIVACLNIDGVNPFGMADDLTIIGKGHSTLDEIVAEEAKAQGRHILDEQEPEKGYFFRSDHFNFVKKGVPSLFASGGYELRGQPEGKGKELLDAYVATSYHQPSDEYDPTKLKTEGMVQDAQLYFNVAWRLANSEVWPTWKEDSEFSRPE